VFFNPELRRNIWLDFNYHRIIMAPIIIGLIVYIVYLTGSQSSAATIAFELACFFIFLWGTKRSSETVIDEINNSTWDFQRQSSISPWAMTWGKLIGSTLYSWYGTAICLLLYSLLRTNTSHDFSGQILTSSLSISQELSLLLLGGLFSQAIALLLSIQVLSQIRREKTNKTFRYFLAAFIIGAFTTNFCFNALKGYDQQISWHGYAFALGPFALTSLILFLGWAIIGLQRSFCKELQYQNIPWIWAGFNIFCMIYFSGLTSFQDFQFENLHFPELETIQQQLANAPLYTALFSAQLLTYFSLFTDDLSLIRYKHFFSRIKEHNTIESLQQLPWWTISFTLTVIAGLIAMIKQQGVIFEKFSPTIFILTSIFFLLRDIELIHYFNFSKNPKKALSTAVLYLFLLYMLLPLLFSALHLNSLLPLFLPSWGQNTLLAFIGIVVQLGLLSALCYKRWQENLEKAKTVIKTSL